MSLLTYQDLEAQKNITLQPDGQTQATTLGRSIVAWAERRTGRVFEKRSVTEYFDGGASVYYLTNTPVDVTVAPVITVYNPSTTLYDAFPYTASLTAEGMLSLAYPVASYPRGLSVTYTAGYDATTLPADLKQALVELLVQKFESASEGGKSLKRVTVDTYTEEYDISATSGVDQIMEVVDSYKVVRVF